MPPLPLEGMRVIDMTVVWAGPFGGALLGDLGAEVIKIDSTQRLDPNSRGQNFSIEQLRENGGNPSPDAKPWNMSANFNSVGRNKKSVTMDLLRPEGREVFYRLAKNQRRVHREQRAGRGQAPRHQLRRAERAQPGADHGVAAGVWQLPGRTATSGRTAPTWRRLSATRCCGCYPDTDATNATRRLPGRRRGWRDRARSR